MFGTRRSPGPPPFTFATGALTSEDTAMDERVLNPCETSIQSTRLDIAHVIGNIKTLHSECEELSDAIRGLYIQEIIVRPVLQGYITWKPTPKEKSILKAAQSGRYKHGDIENDFYEVGGKIGLVILSLACRHDSSRMLLEWSGVSGKSRKSIVVSILNLAKELGWRMNALDHYTLPPYNKDFLKYFGDHRTRTIVMPSLPETSLPETSLPETSLPKVSLPEQEISLHTMNSAAVDSSSC